MPDLTPITDQPAPAPSSGDCWRLVIEDMEERRRLGIERYGTPLQPHNGRDALVDLYQELLDACVYARQAIAERDAAKAPRLSPAEGIAAIQALGIGPEDLDEEAWADDDDDEDPEDWQDTCCDGSGRPLTCDACDDYSCPDSPESGAGQ